MALDADQVMVAGTGKVLIAAVGTTAPTDVDTAWAAGWKDLGYTTEAGVILRPSRTVTEVPAWQSLEPIRRVPTARNLTVVFTLLQVTREALQLAFSGGAFTGTDPVTYDPGDAGDTYERALGIEAVDGTKIIRLIVPRVETSDVGDIPFTGTGPANIPLTMAMLGASGASPFTIIADATAIEAAA